VTSDVIVGLLSLAGTLIGAFAGILVSNRLVVYRIDQLEKRVEKHNQVVERTIALERDVQSALKAIDELKG
jgi:hypothetical protein